MLRTVCLIRLFFPFYNYPAVTIAVCHRLVEKFPLELFDFYEILFIRFFFFFALIHVIIFRFIC